MRRAGQLFVLCVSFGVGLGLVAPLYKQCDPRWGSHEMGIHGPGERATICREGCAMTSASMLLASLGVQLNGTLVNPSSLNAYLIGHKGYKCIAGDCNNLVLDSPDSLAVGLSLLGEFEKPSLDEMKGALRTNTIAYIAHVRNRTHFVLLLDWSTAKEAFRVNDPFFETDYYTYESIADVIAYVLPQHRRDRADKSAIIPHPYPLYKQCDPRWGKDLMVTETICAVGCLMSSTSMAIGGHHILISGHMSNPKTLNGWLRANNGYTSGNDLIESVVPRIDPSHISWPKDAMHLKNDIPYGTIAHMLKSGRPVIANVMHGHHFVLVVGYDASDKDTLYINDPGFNRSTYSYSDDVVGWRLFNMTNPGW